MKKDIYISILEFGMERGIAGVSYHDLYDHLCHKGYLSTDELVLIKKKSKQERTEEVQLKKRAIDNTFEHTFYYIKENNVNIRVLTPDAYFQLLEHEELKLARKSASTATKFSFLAIGIALLSLIFSYLQSKQPLTLNEAQLATLTETTYNDTNVISNIKNVADHQNKSNILLLELKAEIVELRTEIAAKKDKVKKE